MSLTPNQLKRIRELRAAVPGLRLSHYRDMVLRGYSVAEARAIAEEARTQGVDLAELRAENNRLREERDNVGATLQKLANEADLYASGKLREHTERLMSVAASLRAYIERNCDATDEAMLHLGMAESAILRARDALEGHE